MIGHGVSLLVGYLIGSISFTRIISARIAPHMHLSDIKVKDERTGASYRRAPNATTASMVLGWKAGMAISLLDMAKAVIPIIILRSYYPQQTYFLAATVGALLGHNWPLYYGFEGGSGLSVIYGALLTIDPLSVPVTVLAGLFFGLIVMRSMVLTFVLPMLLLIPWFWYRTGNTAYVLFALALNAGYFVTYIADVRQYLAMGKDRMITERIVMEQMPIGRGMLKMLDKLGLKKER